MIEKLIYGWAVVSLAVGVVLAYRISRLDRPADPTPQEDDKR
jgi:hypothetical protein